MAFIKNEFSSSFIQNSLPKLISVYQAAGKYTEMPRVMHKHDDILELILISDGYGVHIIKGKKYYTEKGDLLIFNSGTIHDESPVTNLNLSIYTCALTDLQLPGLPANHLISSTQTPVLKTGSHFAQVQQLLQLMYDYITQKNYHAEEFTNYLLRAFLILINGLIQNIIATDIPEENQLAQQIKTYIDTYCMDDLTLNTLSADLHISTYYIVHIFKKVYGYTPIQYAMRRRIGEAQTLLIDTNLNITDIATKVGYNSPNYFTGIFTKITGVTPRKYRELYHKI
jgi:AraC-like DNA-binding protein